MNHASRKNKAPLGVNRRGFDANLSQDELVREIPRRSACASLRMMHVRHGNPLARPGRPRKKNGRNRDRTCDYRLKRPVLYQLSYTPDECGRVRTCDPRLRKPSLSPTELRTRMNTAGIEPATPCLGSRRSIQLSYVSEIEINSTRSETLPPLGSVGAWRGLHAFDADRSHGVHQNAFHAHSRLRRGP